ASMRRRGRLRFRSPLVIVRSYGPAMATSVSMPSFAATATASATVIDPPPAGTTPEPLEMATPLLTFTERVPPAQLAEMPPTVTLDTLAPEITGTMVTPSVSHRGTAAEFPPRVFEATAGLAAKPYVEDKRAAVAA